MALRVGVIGAGSMGKHHVRIYSELPTVELVGVADIDESVAELAAIHNVRFHKDYQELLKQAPELVSIAVPTSLHVEVALAALEAGCHLLIEKPISNTLDSAGAIIESAKERGRKVFVGHVERFNPAVIALKDAISSGKLGEVHSISNLRVGAYNRRIFDTGIILDLGSHDIDLISYLYSRKAEAVFALGAAKIHEYEDHAAISLKFAQSAAGYIELSWLSPYKVRKMFVVGTEHFGLVDLIQQSLIVYDGKDWVDTGLVERDEPLKLELASLVEAVLNDQPPAVSGEDSLYTIQVALAAIESYSKGDAVHFPEHANEPYPTALNSNERG
ncbi:Gfo/Idh/MocA family oxidoreductase [bacterium]|nr:Gfo/Idh/MocA family oxidoreductase [bacterium]